MKSVKSWMSSAVVALAASLAAGCSGGLNEVTGTVTLDGKPVKGLEVNFEPIDPGIGTTATGYTQADGSYKLHYPGDKTGAPAGEYRVRIAGGENDGEGPPIRVAKKYNKDSELKATITSGANVHNFEVTSK